MQISTLLYFEVIWTLIATRWARLNAAAVLVSFYASFTSSKLIYSSIALDDSQLKRTNGCSQWFLSRLASEKPTARRVEYLVLTLCRYVHYI